MELQAKRNIVLIKKHNRNKSVPNPLAINYTENLNKMDVLHSKNKAVFEILELEECKPSNEHIKTELNKENCNPNEKSWFPQSHEFYNGIKRALSLQMPTVRVSKRKRNAEVKALCLKSLNVSEWEDAPDNFSFGIFLNSSFSYDRTAKHLLGSFPNASKKKDSLKQWIRESPIYIADGRNRLIPKFPDRKRHLICFICGEKNSELTKCSASSCTTSFHNFCARHFVGGAYNFEFMQRNKGIYCPRHHCTGCFSDHNRVRCFNGVLVRCSQCELSWHVDCVPGGCEINSKSEIICPRHVIFPNPANLHTTHCADCQQKFNTKEQLIHCTNCLRSLHVKCYKESSLTPVNEAEFLRDVGECNWCKSFDFVRYGQYCMARLGSTKWYPCQIVPNDQYPKKTDSLLRSIGYAVVKWLPYQNKFFYNLVSHNRIIPMTEKDYFFVTEARNSGIYDEWKLAQQYTVQNNPENSLPKEDQISPFFSNGERRCKYFSPDLRPSKSQLQTPDLCHCPIKMEDRCGPSSSCINRALRVECPKLCESKGICNNRTISNGQNCISVSIVPSSNRYYGAITQENLPKNGFAGEYVGEIITHEEKQRRIDRIGRMNSNEAQYYIMDLDGQRAIDAMYYGNDMRYVNHSCEPNCSVQSDVDIHLVLVALRNIEKGEELSFDYNMYSTNSGRTVPKCRCNAKNCSGILSAAGTTPSVSKKKAPLNENSKAIRASNSHGKNIVAIQHLSSTKKA